MGKAWGSLPKTNISVLGYALFITINATSLWGGVFPFFPVEFHTPEVTMIFSLAQSLAYCSTFFLTMLAMYYRPKLIQKTMVFLGGVPIVLGTCSLIAAMYLKAFTLEFVAAGGVLLGAGCAGFAMAWQRYFSSETPDRGTYFLLAGTACAPIIFFSLYLIPRAVTVYLVPTVLVPLCGLCAILSTNTIDLSQSQFSEVPCEHPKVYRRLIGDYWRSAIGIGSFGLVSGLVRAIAVADPSVGDVTNAATMIGAFIAAVVLIVAWKRWSFQFDSVSIFKALFPLAITCLALFAFLGHSYASELAGIVYMLFSVANLIMLLQCAQASRDRGVNPAFLFGFYGGVVYLMQNVGFIFSYSNGISTQFDQEALLVIIVAGFWTLGMALVLQYQGAETPRSGTSEQTRPSIPDPIEFVSPRKTTLKKDDSPKKPTIERSEAPQIRDRLSKQCKRLQENYKLSNREAEVMELVVRGNSVARISEMLFISENTVRTHTKRIYTKLGVHKRQEILDMLDGLDG